jgi:DNA-binding XRE family transcriptional regulator
MTKSRDMETEREVNAMDGNLEKRKIRGRRLKRFREAAGMTQESLGKMLGLASPSSHISQIEGGSKGMSLEQVDRIAAIFDVHPAVIQTGKDYTDEQLHFMNHCFNVMVDPDPSTRAVVHSVFNARCGADNS